MGLTTSSSSALLLKSPTGLNRNLIRAGTRRFSSPLHSSAQSPELLKENNFLCWKEGDVTLPCFQCQTLALSPLHTPSLAACSPAHAAAAGPGPTSQHRGLGAAAAAAGTTQPPGLLFFFLTPVSAQYAA